MVGPVGREIRLTIESWWLRATLLGVVVLVAAAALVAVRSHQRARPLSHSFDSDALKAALSFSPNQSRVHSRLALAYLYDPVESDLDQAVKHLQQAVRLNPFDFNAWTMLAKGYEEAGDVEKAEKCYVKAIELAPAYFYPRWHYANFLLRRGRTEPAVAELVRLADINIDAVENIAELIWQSSEQGAEAVARLGLALNSQKANQLVCEFLIAREAFVAAIEVWTTLDWDRTVKPPLARSLVSGLIGDGEYDRAQDLWREWVKRDSPHTADELFWNGDFEHELPSRQPSAVSHESQFGLDWRIESTDQVKAGIVESERHDGKKSLLVEFVNPERVRFSGVEHHLILESATSYRLQFRYKVRDLISAGGISVEIETVADSPQRIAGREIAPGEAETEWMMASLEFETPPGVRAVVVRIVRAPSGRYYDFVKGKMWFDSFSLERMKASDK
jgi:hypothetical protein